MADDEVSALLCKADALAGDVEAMWGLSYLYEHGIGVARDEVAADLWWRKAAEAGHAEAARTLAYRMIFKPRPGEDPRDGYRLLRTVAEAGDAAAQLLLFFALSDAEMEWYDCEEAAHWLLRAAEQGHAPARHTLGYCLSEGEATPRSPVEACVWYRLGVGSGDADIAASCRADHDELLARMTRAQRALVEERLAERSGTQRWH